MAGWGLVAKESDKDFQVSPVSFYTTLVSSKLLNPMSEHLLLPGFQIHYLRKTHTDRKFCSVIRSSLSKSSRGQMLIDELKPWFTFRHGSLRSLGMSPVLVFCLA